MAAAHILSPIRSALAPGSRKDRRVARHGDDGKSGRLGSAHQHHAGGFSKQRWSAPAVWANRTEMVHVGPNVRRFSGFGAGKGWTELLSGAALDARPQAQCGPPVAA